MAIIPSDIEPFVLEAIEKTRKRIDYYNGLIATTSSPSTEELSFWNAQVINYQSALTALLLTLETP